MIKYIAIVVVLLAAGVAASAASAQNFAIVGTNSMQFSKTHLTVTPGEKVTVTLTTRSHLPASAMSHNWVLLKAGTDVDAFADAARNSPSNDYIPASMAGDIIAHTDMVSGGHSDSVTFAAPKNPGDYEYICTFPGHYQAGMKGVLTVSAAAPDKN